MNMEEVQKILSDHPEPHKLREVLDVICQQNYYAGYMKGYRNAVTCQRVINVDNGSHAA